MTRAISIVLIVAIALQTVGCSTWRPIAHLNDVPEDGKQTLIQGQFPGKLKKGMRATIKIRPEARAPINGRVIECIVEKVGPTTLTIIPMTFNAPSNAGRKLTLLYSDIESIEYRESEGNLPAFGGVVAGVILGLLLIGYGLSGITLD
ncbi:MAG: hypothetical protein OXU79_21235 [Gemmatimonadota bacterium]|nr:hypothetical protein [Gemmatimonadota bacterium]